MKEEAFYGNDDLFNWNDGHASRESSSSAFSSQEEPQVVSKPESQPHSDFNHSNRRLDSYHLFFSSRL